ncbi:MAG: ATP-binding cassette domain-containing protein [Bryobacteraceae bacterium]
MELVATLRGLPRKRSHDKMSSLLESLTLTHARHAPIASYSKGMRQRIVLIAALLHDPEVLILDEPFSGLDVTSVLVVRRVIEILAGQGKAIFFSSPVLEVMEKICSKIVILKKGIVVASSATQDISNSFSRGDLESVFLHLTDEVDADRVAGNIVAAVNDASG